MYLTYSEMEMYQFWYLYCIRCRSYRPRTFLNPQLRIVCRRLVARGLKEILNWVVPIPQLSIGIFHSLAWNLHVSFYTNYGNQKGQAKNACIDPYFKYNNKETAWNMAGKFGIFIDGGAKGKVEQRNTNLIINFVCRQHLRFMARLLLLWTISRISCCHY